MNVRRLAFKWSTPRGFGESGIVKFTAIFLSVVPFLMRMILAATPHFGGRRLDIRLIQAIIEFEIPLPPGATARWNS